MSFDRDALSRAVADGPVARVVIAEAKGSVPRNAGAAMLVRAGWQSGTIGGGALEWEATRMAREALAAGRDRLDRVPLGPNLGQCCGGAVTLLTETWDEARLAKLGEVAAVARALPGTEGAMPASVARLVAAAKVSPAPTRMNDGWLIEPVAAPENSLWVWGAGHVGRAIVGVLAPLPDPAITWVDTAAERFPKTIPDGVSQLMAVNPADLVRHAPKSANHLILTFSHEIDLDLCHALLSHGFAACGLIGSETKWARFRSRLQALGHGRADIDRIACPIGDPGLGKHPQAIAIGVAADILRRGERGTIMDKTA